MKRPKRKVHTGREKRDNLGEREKRHFMKEIRFWMILNFLVFCY